MPSCVVVFFFRFGIVTLLLLSLDESSKFVALVALVALVTVVAAVAAIVLS